jgi:hypothetical protein
MSCIIVDLRYNIVSTLCFLLKHQETCTQDNNPLLCKLLILKLLYINGFKALIRYISIHKAEKETVENAKKWIDLIKQFSIPIELTAELLNPLIEKIVVHEATKT